MPPSVRGKAVKMCLICLQGMDRPEGGRHRRRASAVPQTLQLTDCIGVGGGQEDSVTSASVVEVKTLTLD